MNKNVKKWLDKNFNSDISNWDISKLRLTRYMFAGNKYFNQDISNWDVSNVTDMAGMFAESESRYI